MSRYVAIVLLALSLAACKKQESMSVAAEIASTPLAAPVAPRMIIRNANLAIVVADTSKAVEKVTATAEAFGGYVSDSKVWREGELLRATISFRVPADKLSAALAAVRGAAVRVQSESISSDEVTEEFVDVEARLKTLEATATAHVDLIPDAIAKPVVEQGWQPVVIAKDASRSLVKALQALAEIVIWALIYFAPIVLMLTIVVLAGRRAITLVWRTRKSPSL